MKDLKMILFRLSEVMRRSPYSLDYLNDYIFPLMFLKWLWDNHDQETSIYIKNDKIIEIFQNFSWIDIQEPNNFRSINDQISIIFKLIAESDPIFEEIFIFYGFNKWEKIDNKTLQEIISIISDIDFNQLGIYESETIIEIYEKLISEHHKYSGELITPESVRKLVINLVKPQTSFHICDPSCRNGGLLIECVRYFKEHELDYKDCYLYGQEINHKLRSIAIIKLIMSGVFPRVSSESILKKLPLTDNHEIQKFDLVITNPPFGIKNWKEAQKIYIDQFYFKYGLPPNSSADYAFIQNILAILHQNGKAVIVVPHGVLFRGGVEGKIRAEIIKDDVIEAVIGLPQGLFETIRIATAIIIFNRQKTDERKNKILFVDASQQYEKRTRKIFLSDENIQEISNIYQDFQEKPGYSAIATNEQIADNDYVLNINNYVVSIENTKKTNNINEQVQKMKSIESKKHKISEQINDCLRELGIQL